MPPTATHKAHRRLSAIIRIILVDLVHTCTPHISQKDLFTKVQVGLMVLR